MEFGDRKWEGRGAGDLGNGGRGGSDAAGGSGSSKRDDGNRSAPAAAEEARELDKATPRCAAVRSSRGVYVPPRLRKEMEERARHNPEAQAPCPATEASRQEPGETERKAALEAAKQAGRERLQREAEERAKKDRARRELAAANRAERNAAAAAAASTPQTDQARLRLVLRATVRGDAGELKARDVSAALPTALQVQMVDDGTVLVAFRSVSAVQRALGDERLRTFDLHAITDESPAAIYRAALEMDLTPEVRPRSSASTATRLITGSLQLSREERDAARALASERRREELAAREREVKIHTEAQQVQRDGKETDVVREEEN